MKYFLSALFLFCALFGESTAYFSNENLKQAKQSINAFLRTENQADITITYELENKTNQPQTTTFLFPTPASANDFTLFLDAEGQSLETIQGESRIQNIWEQANTTKNPRIFSFASKQYQQLTIGKDLSIPAHSKVLLKFSYIISTENKDEWKYLSFPLDTKKSADFFEISFQSPAEKIPHFFHNIPEESLINKAENNQAILFKKINFTPNDNIWFLWTTAKNQTLHYKNFTAEAIKLPDSKKFQKATILLDASGSMSDNAWELTEDIVTFLFDHFSKNTDLQILLFNDDLTAFPENGFEKNTRELHQQVLEKIRGFFPVGKTNIQAAFESISNESEAVFLITDETDFSLPETGQDWIVLSFASQYHPQSDQPQPNHFFQNLWRHTPSFLEGEKITQLLQNIRPELKKSADFFPESIKRFSQTTRPIFVKKTESNSLEKAAAFSFLPRYWATQKIANILDRIAITPGIADTDIDDILAIGRIFGVQTDFFGPETSRTTLRTYFKNTIDADIILEAKSLKQRDFSNGYTYTKFIDETPHYYSESESLWRQYNFWDTATSEFLISISPFSEAQRELFYAFPEKFADFFALGKQAEFCFEIRCFSIKEKQRTQSLLGDKAFLKGFPTQHWAKPYLIQLINQQIFRPDSDGKIRPDDPITRGVFAQMVVDFFRISPKTENTPDNADIFTDISPEDEYFNAVKILSHAEIINGYEDGTFRPNQALSRAEAVKILLSANGVTPDKFSVEPIFIDTLGWERPWAKLAYTKKIIQGRLENDQRFFDPHRSITRAEASKIILEF